MIGSFVVVCALTLSALLQSVYNLKATKMKVKLSLIRERMIYEFKLIHNATEGMKTFVMAKGECEVYYNTVTKWSQGPLQSGKVIQT